MSDNEGGAEGGEPQAVFNFDDWAASLGLKRNATQLLRQEDCTSKEALMLLEARDLKELGLTMGTVKILEREIKKMKCAEQGQPIRMDASGENGPPVLDNNCDILEGAGKTLDALLTDKPPLPSKQIPELFGQMDPRTILTLKSQSNKAIHITQFLTEKTKRRRQKKKERIYSQIWDTKHRNTHSQD